MMRPFIFIVFILVFSKNISSQKILPVLSDVPRWNVYSKSWTWYVTDKIQYAYDTVFCGQQYTKVIDTSGYSYGYVRINANRAFLRVDNDCKKQELTLYNYSLKIGDTLTCGIYSGMTTKFWLTQIDTVNYSGVNRIRFKMKYDLGIIKTMYWIKGIGSTVHPFYPSVCMTDNCEMEYKLLCYRSADTLFYQNPAFAGCDITNAGLQENNKNTFSLFIAPNPFRSSALITLKSQVPQKIQIDLYAFSGEKLSGFISNNPNTQFKVGDDLPCGIYFLRISSGNKYLIKRIVKTE
jgi:hypothetical protein